MSPELQEVLHTQATRMIPSMREQLEDFLGGGELEVAGYVFRPAADEDMEDQEDRDQNSWWVFEAHYVPTGGSIASSLANKVLLSFDLGMTYGDACQKVTDIIRKADGNPDQG